MNKHAPGASVVCLTNGVPTTTSLAIAEGGDVQHKNVMALIRQYLDDLQDFGPIAFKTRKGEPLPQGGFAKATEIAILNEQQTTLLFTYMKNTAIVRQFKKRLVREFYDLANGVKPAAPSTPRSLSTFLPPDFPARLAAYLADKTQTTIHEIGRDLLGFEPGTLPEGHKRMIGKHIAQLGGWFHRKLSDARRTPVWVRLAGAAPAVPYIRENPACNTAALPAPPSAELLRVLTDLLARAAAGEITGLVYLTQDQDFAPGAFSIGLSGSCVDHPVLMVGQLEVLKRELLEQAEQSAYWTAGRRG
jgi:hypothetical protein